MEKERYDYDVRCKTCYGKFTTQLFESHEKNLWLVDKKDWYCETCKKKYFEEQTEKLTKAHAEIGFSRLSGSAKRISWAEKIRAELLNKVTFLKESLKHTDEDEKQASDHAFHLFLQEWQEKKDAKWWIENRRTTVRDISDRIKQLSDSPE